MKKKKYKLCRRKKKNMRDKKTRENEVTGECVREREIERENTKTNDG
jgi:hypothetical protein